MKALNTVQTLQNESDCHAALPLVLTPALINYLHTYFLHGQVAWKAETDLLLPDLCPYAGYELSVMNMMCGHGCYSK